MMGYIVFFVLAATAVIAAGILHTRRIHALLSSHTAPRTLFPKGVAMLLVVAHFSELLHAVEHLSLVHITIALLLLLAWKAGVSGPQEELL